MKIINLIAGILAVVGAVNWGLVGLFNFNLVTVVFGSIPVLVKIIYILVGVSGLWVAFTGAKCCRSE